MHTNVTKFLEGFRYDAHPMGMLLGAVGALSTFYPDAKHVSDPENRHLQRIRLMAKLPTIAAYIFRHSRGLPYVLPRNDLGYIGNFVNMTFEIGGRHEANPVLQRALEILLILHADHEQNCSTNAVRGVGSSQVDPFSAVSAGIAALYGPLHGGANEAVLRMLDEVGDTKNVPAFIEQVKAGTGRLMGFGHRVYKSYDPRAKLIKRVADSVFAETGLNPKLEVALELERIALEDDYFVSRRLYPNVDFYSGLIYQAMGYSTDYFTVLFALGRLPGLDRPVGGDAHRSGAEDRAAASALRRRRRARVRADRRALGLRYPAARHGRGRLHQPVPQRDAHRARRPDLADRRVPARQAGQGRRVRPHEAEDRSAAARSSTARSEPVRSSTASAPRRRTCSTCTTRATRSSSWTRRPSTSSRSHTVMLEDELPFMQPSSSVQVLFVDGSPSGVDLPASVVLEVTETEPGVKGDTVSNVTKPATLETGAVVQVPLFVNVGDRIKVDPREKRYIARDRPSPGESEFGVLPARAAVVAGAAEDDVVGAHVIAACRLHALD